jgi:hypothetical protein
MSFKTLENRFSGRANGIYNKFSNPEQLQPKKPDFPKPSTAIRHDSRIFPIESTKRDVSFLTKYITSPRGREQFIVKQLLLQKTNTFAETRFYNPLGVLGSAVPMINVARHIGPNIYSAKNTGALQLETVNSANGPRPSIGARLLGGLGRLVDFDPFNNRSTWSNAGIQYPKRPEDTIFYPVNNAKGPRLPARQSGELRGQPKGIRYPEDEREFTPTRITKTIFTSSTGSKGYTRRQSLLDKLVKEERRDDPKKTLDKSPYSTSKGTTSEVSGSQLKDVSIFTLSSKFTDKYKGYASQRIDGTTDSRNKLFLNFGNNSSRTLYINPYGLNSSKKFAIGFNSDANAALAIDITQTKKSALRDILNVGVVANPNSATKLTYDALPAANLQKDIINFTFKHTNGNSKAVQFRAFISELSEQIETEYNEDRYLGRTERFVTYAGAKRAVKLKFMIVAFSEDEIDNVWLRINYLTGLTFPKDASSSGFMVPPLFRITIGNIYEDQPTYIKNLDYTFIDDKMTFDIDAEVPQRIEVTMQLQLLEKATRFFDSPFYAISEKLNGRTQVRIDRQRERQRTLIPQTSV